MKAFVTAAHSPAVMLPSEEDAARMPSFLYTFLFGVKFPISYIGIGTYLLRQLHFSQIFIRTLFSFRNFKFGHKSAKISTYS